MRAVVAFACLLALGAGCDVEASLGAHDAGVDSPAPMCAAPDASACIACEATMCCDAFTACAAATTCPCIVDCVLTGHGVDACVTHCGGADHDEHAPLLVCTQGHCAAACP